MKVRILTVVAALALAGCVTIGPGGQVQRDAGAHALWSILIPGVGQFLNGDVGKGVLMMGINVANNSYLLDAQTQAEYDERATTCLAVGIGVSVWSAADAYSSANRFNQGQGRRTYRARAPAVPETTPITVSLDLLNKRLLTGVNYRF